MACHDVANSGLVPIFSVPEVMDLITNELTVPSASNSLPLACKSANEISTAVFSAVVSTGAEKAVKVGASLVPVMVILAFCVLKAPRLSLTRTV